MSHTNWEKWHLFSLEFTLDLFASSNNSAGVTWALDLLLAVFAIIPYRLRHPLPAHIGRDRHYISSAQHTVCMPRFSLFCLLPCHHLQTLSLLMFYHHFVRGHTGRCFGSLTPLNNSLSVSPFIYWEVLCISNLHSLRRECGKPKIIIK